MMGRWAFLSAALHALIIIMGIIGLWNYKTDVLDIVQPLPVELVDHIEETAKSPDPLPDSPEEEKPKEEEHKPLPTPEPAPLPEPAPKTELKPETIVPLPPEEKPKAEPKKEPKPPEPKPVEPPKTKPKPPKKKPKPETFDSVLKNLMKNEPKKPKGRGGELSDRLAASELDRVRKQIENDWRVPAGVKGMHEISISVRIAMNPDRTVRSVSLVNQHLLSNPTYRILAESVLKAVNQFRYKPLAFPPNKYKVWKEINMDFDPRNML